MWFERCAEGAVPLLVSDIVLGQTMTGLGSQDWSEPVHHTFDLPSVEGPFNFVNSEGLLYEAQAVNECLAKGKTQCDEFDHRENLAVMGVLSEIRGRWGGS